MPEAGPDDVPSERAEGEEDPFDDDLPAPETGLHALGQLGTAVLVVAALILALLAIALPLGWIFR